MKIVLIHGQNHKGSTYHIGRSIADGINCEKEITEFFLPKDLEHFCTGCMRCIDDDSRCPFYTEKRRIMDAVEAADLLIFTTPTYCMRSSSPLKAFMELNFTCWMVHRPRECMFTKKAVVVSTAAGMGTVSAIKDVTLMLSHWGVPEVHTCGFSVQASGWDAVAQAKKAKIAKAVYKLATRLSADRPPKVGLKTKLLFGMMRMMQNKGWGSSPAETEYWRQKGWLGHKRPWKA